MQYWVKEDIGKDILRRISQVLNGYKISAKKVEQVDIIFGGDHGKGAFWLPVKVVLTIDGREEAIDFIDIMATIWSRTESIEVLENTITLEVNDAMEKLVKNHLVFTQEEAGPAELRFADDVLLVSDDSPDPVHTLKANLYLSGDIKFYCTVLGKNGFARSQM